MKIKFLLNKATFMNDVFGWDVGTWSKAIPVWKECIEKNSYKKGLEIGNAFGGGSLFLAKHGISMVCSNIHSPDKKTKQIHKRYTFNKKIVFIEWPENLQTDRQEDVIINLEHYKQARCVSLICKDNNIESSIKTYYENN